MTCGVAQTPERGPVPIAGVLSAVALRRRPSGSASAEFRPFPGGPGTLAQLVTTEGHHSPGGQPEPHGSSPPRCH